MVLDFTKVGKTAAASSTKPKIPPRPPHMTDSEWANFKRSMLKSLGQDALSLGDTDSGSSIRA